jgi:hypothetical protein
MDSVYAWQTHNENATHKEVIREQYLDLPLVIGYEIGINKFSVGTSAGIQNRIVFTNKQIEEQFPLSGKQIQESSNSTSYQPIMQYSLHVGYAVNAKLNLNISPVILFNLNDSYRGLNEARLRIGATYFIAP